MAALRSLCLLRSDEGVNICSACGEIEVTDRITTPFLYDFESLYRDLNEAKHEAEDLGAAPIDVRTDLVKVGSTYLDPPFRILKKFDARCMARPVRRQQLQQPVSYSCCSPLRGSALPPDRMQHHSGVLPQCCSLPLILGT